MPDREPDRETDAVPAIAPVKDGPLNVTGLSRFSNSRGDPIATKKVFFLCRCGASKTKPFCDGAHSSIGFSEAESSDRVPDRLDE